MGAVDTDVATTGPYLENMRRLWRADPRLAHRLDELDPAVGPAIELARSGAPTAKVAAGDGRTQYLHSRFDPAKEAADFVAALEARDAACAVLCGLGLGHHVKALHARYGEDALVVALEPDLGVIQRALEALDLSRELAEGRLILLNTLDKSTWHDRLAPYATNLMLGTVIAVPPAARALNADFFTQARQAVADYVAFVKMSVATLLRNADVTCRNIANNLPVYVTTPPTEALRGRFAGRPAILVAAGPSLAKNIDQLGSVQDRAVIIAAQTTLRPLIERGIRPHFVTALDFSDLSRQFFENLDLPNELVLVAEPKAHWQVADTFMRGRRGGTARIVMLDNEFAHRCVGEALARRAKMEAGATVMHLAFYLAQWLGCDPIIFIGQDLAFGGHVYYAPGVAMHRAWGPELGRYCTLEMKEWERIARSRKMLRKVRDIDGREIYTEEQMYTYLQQFERDFARCAARVIDATEGGAAKAGVEVMPLARAIEQFCTRAIDAACFDGLRLNWHDASRLRPAREQMALRRRELNDFRELCGETSRRLSELEGLLHSPAEFNRRVGRIDELRTAVQRHELIFRMVRDVSQVAELQKFAADRRLGQEGAAGVERARRQLERDRRFIDALIEGCAVLGDILDGSLRRFDEAIARTEKGIGT